jgi:rod shape determining protein RodA
MTPTTPIQPSSTDAGVTEPTLNLPRIDWLLLLAVLGLMGCSLAAIGHSTANDIAGQPHYYLDRQVAYFAVGLLLSLGFLRFDYTRLREMKFGFYGIMIGSILAVYGLGSAARGSKRAISLPFFSFQASELGKLLLILVIAAFLVDRVRHLNERETTLRTLLLALVPALMVVAQPDLGSGLVYIVIALSTLFIAGTSGRHFAVLGAIFVSAIVITFVAAPAMGVQVLHGYQKDRLTAFLSPSQNPKDQGYQQTQSRIAIGAGQRTGRGNNATQTRLNFLPEHHTDFIFAVIGETWGFLGAAILLTLYALLIWRGLRILTLAKNLYGAIVAGGIVGMLLFQIVINVGMNIGIMPITGIPLPLVSYGGSSVIVTLLSIGLLQSIHAQARATAASKGRTNYAF